MAKNHIIIGLGGTGGKIIREFRKNIFQDFRVKEFRDLPENDSNTAIRNTNIRYIFIDSSEKDLHNVESWKILGDDVALKEGSKLLLEKQNLNSILANIKQFPNMEPWIGAPSDWPDTIASGSETAAGQKRRYGRFLLAANIAKFSEYLKSR